MLLRNGSRTLRRAMVTRNKVPKARGTGAIESKSFLDNAELDARVPIP